MRTLVLTATAAIALGLGWASSLYSDEPAQATKATFLITGLHCPPCTNTVQGSLSRVKGVKSVSVDWNTKRANVQFDENVLPAQALAAAIDTTPHMMGAGMRYGGWLALSVPSLTDDASGTKVKEALGKVAGVKSIATYPAQHKAAVLFAGTGSMSSRQVIESLAKEGIEASTY